jgi:hypothetical protein
VAYGGGLENRFRLLLANVGSNPTPSAIWEERDLTRLVYLFRQITTDILFLYVFRGEALLG